MEAERIRALAAKAAKVGPVQNHLQDAVSDGGQHSCVKKNLEKLPRRPARAAGRRLPNGGRARGATANYDICFHFGKKFDLTLASLNDLHSALGFTSSEVPLIICLCSRGQGGAGSRNR